jgi:uncharacterized protein
MKIVFRAVRYAPALLFALACARLFPLDVPAMNGPVNDLAGVMSPAERRELADYLLSIDGRTDAQIAVLTVPSLEGDDIESFSVRVAEAWRLGGEGTDLGALVVVSLSEREMRIETGYGAEAELTDAKCGLIIRNVMAPAFRGGNYGEGISSACRAIAQILTGGDAAREQIERMENAGGKTHGASAVFAGLVFFLLYAVLMTTVAGRRRGRYRGAFLFPAMMSGGLGGHGFGGFGSSGGTRGGSGGTFTGGGGRFGGGGASGRW